MNRRTNERIEMKLPCMVTFPDHWHLTASGYTANMHRDGVLVACALGQATEDLPDVGSKGKLKIELPANHSFGRKCIECDTVLVRTTRTNSGEWQFAMRIRTVAFRDLKAEAHSLMDMDASSTRLPV
jgi:hypothetical protein